MGRAHARGESPVELLGVLHDDQAAPVGILGLEVRHAEELQVEVLALEPHAGIRLLLVVGLGEAEHRVELGDLVDRPAWKERHGDFIGHGPSLDLRRYSPDVMD